MHSTLAYSSGRERSIPSRPFPHRLAVAGLVLLSTALALFVLVFRLHYSGGPGYNFLFKDLLLAWIPLWLALAVVAVNDGGGRRPWPTVLLAALLGLWLLFLPNSPYLLTEFVHLTTIHSREAGATGLSSALNPGRGATVPLWYDVLMLLLFAWNGLVLGLLSLRLVQQVVRRRWGTAWGWVAALTGTLLGAFGVTLGRFERFNSWDLFSKPGRLFGDVAARLLHPLSHPRTTGATLILAGLLLVAYLTLVALLNFRPGEEGE